MVFKGENYWLRTRINIRQKVWSGVSVRTRVGVVYSSPISCLQSQIVNHFNQKDDLF